MAANASLAALYRPQTFAEVVGQDMVKSILSRAAREDRVAPAYLLSGTRGVGKTTIARIFAKALNCEHAPTGEPCNQCEACRRITQGSFVDVVEIDGASNRGIDDIRRLRDAVGYAPLEGRYKVFIIDEAHMLTKEAFNALLKTLEEPPARVTFILATTEPNKLPVTILSRCQRYDFGRFSETQIAGHLEKVVVSSGMRADPEALGMIARAAEGGMRDALSIMDLCSSYNRDITVDTVSQATGLVAQDYLFKLAEAAHACNTGEFLELVGQAGQSYVEYDRLCEQLIGHYRNLMVAKSSKKPEDLIVCLPEVLQQYKEQARRYFLELRLILTDMNYTPFKGEEFRALEQKMNEKISERAEKDA